MTYQQEPIAHLVLQVLVKAVFGPAGVEEMNQEYFESNYGFEIGDTKWSHFGAGTNWSNFGTSVIPVQAANTIGMQKTGLPLAAIALAILLVTAGLILPKRKQ